MAIDILSRWGSLPIIVGDELDMGKMERLESRDEGVFLVMGPEAERQEIQLSPATEENVLSNLTFLAVALTPDDQIAWAFRCALDDGLDFTAGKDSKSGDALSEPEIKRVAEDLVAGDFQLEFLRRGNDAGAEVSDEAGSGGKSA